MKHSPVFADSLKPGDRCAVRSDGENPYEVLRPKEPAKDMFGRSGHFQYWCRALDGSNREGWVPFGPGGITWRLTEAHQSGQRSPDSEQHG